jgi:hypothetical protein
MVTGLDLEPDAVGQRDHALCATRITLLWDALSIDHDRVIDLFQGDPEVRQTSPKVTEAALRRTHAD